MSGRRTLAVVLVVAMLVLPATLVAAQTRGEAEVSVALPDNRVSAGEHTTLELQVSNQGTVESSGRDTADVQRVTTARGTRVKLRSGSAPIEVRTNTRAVGSIPDGSVVPVPFEVVVDEDAQPGSYRVPVDVDYEFTEVIGENDEFRDTDYVDETLYVRVRIVPSARFEVVETTTDAAVGGSGTVRMTVENVGEAAAEDATFTVESPNQALTFGGSPTAATDAGTWEAGERRTFEFGARVAGDAEPRPLSIRGTVEYEDADGVADSASLSTGVRPATEGDVRVAGVESTAAAGDTGRLRVELENTAGRTLDGARIELRSPNPALTFAGSPTVTAYVGEFGAGQTREVSVEAAFAENTDGQSYAVDATLTYDASDGRTASSRTVTFGARPAAEQSFSLAEPSATLRVDSEGTLAGTISNDGPATAENAVLVLEDPGANVDATEREFALGNLEAGDSTAFEYEVEVSSSARPGPRQFTYRVRYDDADGDTRRTDPLYARHEVAPSRQVFGIETDATVEAGGSSQLEVRVTNNGDEPVSDVSAKLFADSPISVSDDEAFVDAIEPGETETLTFSIGAAGSATPKVYPVSLDFQYDEPDGDTKLSDTYRVPVEVTESGGGGGILSLFAGLGLGGAGLGLVLAVGGLAGVAVVRRSRSP
ncbi:MAG: sialidase [Haloarculaceae archaeon]